MAKRKRKKAFEAQLPKGLAVEIRLGKRAFRAHIGQIRSPSGRKLKGVSIRRNF